MAQTVGGLRIDLSADTVTFERDMGRAGASLNSAQARMNQTLAQMERGFRQVSTAVDVSTSQVVRFGGRILGATVGVVSLNAAIRGSQSTLRTMDDTAERLGVTLDKALVDKAEATALAWERASFRIKSALALGFAQLAQSIPFIGDAAESAVARAAGHRGLGAVPIGQLRQHQTALRSNIGDLEAQQAGMGWDTAAVDKLRDVLGQPSVGQALQEAREDLGAVTTLIQAYDAAVLKVTSSLILEQQAIGRTAVEQRIATAQMEAGVLATSAEGQAIAELIVRNEELKQAEADRLAVQEAAWDREEEARKKRVAQLDKERAAWTQWSGQVSNSIAAAMLKAESFGDSLRNMALELAQAGMSRFVIGPILNAVGAAVGISGARASGGPVDAGQTYLVGERGMELFTPGVSGMVTPMAGGGGGRGGVSIGRIEIGKGASPATIAALWRFVVGVNASIEPRAVAATSIASARSGR